MTERDEDRRIEKELQRRERVAGQPRAPEPARTPAAPGRQAGTGSSPAPQAPMSGPVSRRKPARRMRPHGPGIDAGANRSPRAGAGRPREWSRRHGRSEAATPGALLEESSTAKPPPPFRPKRARARGSCWRSAHAAIALVVQWRFAVIEPRTRGGWRAISGDATGPNARLRHPRRQAGQGHALPGLRSEPNSVAPRRRVGRGTGGRGGAGEVPAYRPSP